MEYKVCTECKQKLSINEFYKKYNYYVSFCKKCYIKRYKTYIKTYIRKSSLVRKEEVIEKYKNGKICSRCKKVLTINEFYIYFEKNMGYRIRSKCKYCFLEDNKKYRLKQKEKGLHVCNKCNKYKPLNEFSESKSINHNCKYGVCKECLNKKICDICGENKDIKEFKKDKNICKKCYNKNYHAKKYQNKNNLTVYEQLEREGVYDKSN